MKLLNNLLNFFAIKYKKVKHGKNLKIDGRIFFHGEKERIIIGDNCNICSSESINPTSGFNRTHLTAWNNGKIIIGDNVGMSNVNIVSMSKIEIEDNVMLGSGTKIWDLDFHPISYNERMDNGQDKGRTKPVLIKEGAFIGACVIILKGVTIGKRAVVGAGAVVTHNIPDDEIWAGNPAKRIGGVLN